MDFTFPGWHLLGAFPDQEPNDVGSWLLHHGGEALLLEIPPGLTVDVVKAGVETLGVGLRYVTASHLHEDHLDPSVWNALIDAFPDAEYMSPEELKGDTSVKLGGEQLWLVKAPKHSPSDVVTIFRGVAMTGDIELGTVESVNDEVPAKTKRASMAYLRGFEQRRSFRLSKRHFPEAPHRRRALPRAPLRRPAPGYKVHTIVSAHLNDLRQNVNWELLFTLPIPRRAQCRRYGCWGNLIPLTPAELAAQGSGGLRFDMKCETCGCCDWSDARKL